MSHGAQVGVPVGFSAVLLAVMLSASGSVAMPIAQPATTKRTTSSPSAQDAATAALEAGGITPIVGQLPPVLASVDGADTGAVRVATDAPPMPAIAPDIASLAPVPHAPGTATIDSTDIGGGGGGHIAAVVPDPAATEHPSGAAPPPELAPLAVVPGADTTSLDAEPPVPASTTTIAAAAAAAAGVAAADTDSAVAEPLRRAPTKRVPGIANEAATATPVESPPLGTPRSVAEPAAATHGAGPTSSAFSTGVHNVDRIRYVRAMAPNREVQRLALDLDGVRISVRMDAGRATVGVLADPDDALGSGWVRQVERNIEQTVRAATASNSGSGTGHSTSGNGAPQQGDGGYDAEQRRGQAQSTWAEHSAAAIAGMRWAEASHHLVLQGSGATTVGEI